MEKENCQRNELSMHVDGVENLSFQMKIEAWWSGEMLIWTTSEIWHVTNVNAFCVSDVDGFGNMKLVWIEKKVI